MLHFGLVFTRVWTYLRIKFSYKIGGNLKLQLYLIFFLIGVDF